MSFNDQKSDYPMDQIFNDLIKECKYVALGEHLSYGLRNRIEKCKPDVQKKIVSWMKDGCAPLFIACKRGHTEIVEYLITVCHADVEQRGRYEDSDNKSVHWVTPLWCAATARKLPVIKCLIAHGADINAASETGSTPVRSACCMAYMDIVSYLVENGADILKANHKGGTCLIISVHSILLCRLLLNHGADVNATDIENKTVLHYAIQDFKFETTKLLLEHKADPHIRSVYNDDALQTACLKGATEIFDYLVENVDYSPERLADANELIGSTLFDEHNDPPAAVKYWRAGMEIRNANMVDGRPLPKRPVLPKRDVYLNATEFSTLEELNSFGLNLGALRRHSMLIRERILGPHHDFTLCRLMFRGASYVDDLRYQCSMDLWRRALEIRVERDSILSADTCYTAQLLLRFMLELDKKQWVGMNRYGDEEGLRFCDAVAIFKLLTSQLTETIELLQKRPVHLKQRQSYEKILTCVTHLIYLMIQTGHTDEQKILTKRLVHDLVRENPRSSTDDTLLHLCVSKWNTISLSYFNGIREIQPIFPRMEVVVELLLECGAYVNARNESRSTPLHIACIPNNFHNTIVKLLLDYGAHVDTPNKTGRTPADMISTNPVSNIILINYMTLQCHAARAICKYGIQCADLPVMLQQSLMLHK